MAEVAAEAGATQGAALSNANKADNVKRQFQEAGYSLVDREQLERLLVRLQPNFTPDDVAKLADGAAAWAFAGSGKICSTALVDWIFSGGLGGGSLNIPPRELVMGDLGSGKTSAYLFRRTDGDGVEVQELKDGGRTDLPSLANTPFEEWAAAFHRAAGDLMLKYPVHIGATQWYREMPVEKQAELGLRLWRWGETASPMGFRLLEVSGHREAVGETSASRYACEAVLNVVPGIIFSAGTGSMQCTSGGVSESVSLDTRAWSQRPREDIPAYREAARASLAPFVKLVREASPSTDLALFLGASWYAIVSAGMAEMNSPPFRLSKAEATRQLVACATNPATSMRDAVNVWRIVECFELLEGVHEVVFGRTWMVNGRLFKTTWSTGYFLDGFP